MTLAIDDLEAYWDSLATAVDAAGPEREKLFLAKLAVLLGDEIGDLARLAALVATALQDLS